MEREAQLEQRLTEALDDLWSHYVDASDAFYDTDGSRWTDLSTGAALGSGGGSTAFPFASEAQLAEIRAQCRDLATRNEFAINGHENRISFIVGRGHAYRVSPSIRQAISAGGDPDQGERSEDTVLCAQVQNLLEEFLEENNWHNRQQEIVRRRDRDGEVFLRFFHGPSGDVRLRFVEPDQVRTPQTKLGDPSAGFGIQCDPDDVENVLGYWIDGRWVESGEIQHRKANVDANVKRGLPLYYPVRKNLKRAEKLLRNMSVVAEIQSAIALIRKHDSGSGASIRRFVDNQAEASTTNPATGRVHTVQRYGPGTILDASGGTEYQFPVAAIDAGRYVTVLQAELRAIASRLVMPEFMLTSDASNANYSSTMVAEGPAVRMFERLQHDMKAEDLDVMRRVVRGAIRAGRFPEDTLRRVRIEAIPPSLAVRDRYREARADELLVRAGAMSIQTLALRHGLDPTDERRLKGEEAPDREPQ